MRMIVRILFLMVYLSVFASCLRPRRPPNADFVNGIWSRIGKRGEPSDCVDSLFFRRLLNMEFYLNCNLMRNRLDFNLKELLNSYENFKNRRLYKKF